MKLKQIITGALVLALAMSFTACGSTAEPSEEPAAEKVVIHVGSPVATTHAWYRAAEQMKQEIAEKSNGSIELVLDFGGVHGSDRETVEAVQNGTLGMSWDADIGFAQVVPEVGYVNLPYLFTSTDQVDSEYYNGWIGEAVKASMASKGFEVLGFADSDFRWMSNSKNPIQAPADLKNLKMRVPPNPMYVKFFTEIGCQPTSMGITEVASALQQKAIDGQDNGPVLTYTFGFNQFQPYLTRTNHAFAGSALLTTKATMDALTPEQQALIREMGAKYTVIATQLLREDIASFEVEMEKGGTQILDVTPELDALFKDAAYTVWNDPESTKTFDQEIMKKLLAEKK